MTNPCSQKTQTNTVTFNRDEYVKSTYIWALQFVASHLKDFQDWDPDAAIELYKHEIRTYIECHPADPTENASMAQDVAALAVASACFRIHNGDDTVTHCYDFPEGHPLIKDIEVFIPFVWMLTAASKITENGTPIYQIIYEGYQTLLRNMRVTDPGYYDRFWADAIARDHDPRLARN